MEMDVNEANGAAILSVSDDLDMLGYQQFSEKLDQMMHAGQKRIVIDLSSVTYINTWAANALLRMSERARKSGGMIALAVLSPGARATLEAVGAIRSLAVHDTVEAATAAIGN